MHLTPRELDKLVLHQAGFVAQKRYSRGLRLNYPEAVALIATQLLEMIRDGRSVAELMDIGKTFLGRQDVLEGVPEMIHEVQVEGTFPDGTKLVTVHHPIVAEKGDPVLALYGSFLPFPANRERENPVEPVVPGAIFPEPGELELNKGRAALSVSVSNHGDRPIQVGSHYHFIEVNRALVFDRERAYGMRLDIPAGNAVRFEPGETKTVNLVAIAGKQVIQGGNGLASGPVNEGNRKAALKNVIEQGFGHAREVKP